MSNERIPPRDAFLIQLDTVWVCFSSLRAQLKSSRRCCTWQCSCVRVCLRVWRSVPGKAVTGCRPRSVNLAALLSSACDRERGGHCPAVAAPVGPIRRERSRSCLLPRGAPVHRSLIDPNKLSRVGTSLVKQNKSFLLSWTGSDHEKSQPRVCATCAFETTLYAISRTART